MKSKLLAALVISASAMFAVVGAQAQDGNVPPDQAQVENNPQQYPQADDQQDGPQQYPQDPQQGQQQYPQQDQQQGQSQATDTNAGVARVSMMHGEVSTQRGDSGGWSAAVLNAPIVSGDKVSTGDKSRAEVQLDFANVLRLGANAQATVAGLTRNNIQVQVAQGLVNYDVFKNAESTAEIDTPNVAIRPSNREGSYRIEVRPNGETEVIVRKGDVDISTPQGNTHLNAGQDAIVRGTSTDAQYKTVDAPPRDDWDRWNSDRNNMIQNAQSWNHTDRYYTGSEDLDANGHWGNVPDYGPVWYPSVNVGWAPYRDGRWVWEPGWGWTWVSYEPWGWAPYHYGRWFQYGGAWAWWPGPVGVGYGFGYPYRPIWAPAYVSFFGFGGGVGFGFGFGSVGWLPIGPCDPFFPWWGGFRGRFTVVDFHHFNDFHRFGGFGPLHGGDRFSNLRLAATDARFRGSISVVDAHHFGTGSFRARGLSEGEFRNARMMGGNLPVVPSRGSLSASNRAANPSTIHNGAAGHFFGSTPTARTASFNREASQMRQNIDRSGGHFTQASANNNRGFENRGGENNAARGGFQNNNSGSRGGFANNDVRNNDAHNNNVPRPGNSSFENHTAENHSAVGNGNNIPRPNSGMQANRNPEVNRSGSNGPENNGFHSFNGNSANGGNRSVGTNMPANNGSFNHQQTSQPMQGNSNMRVNNIPRPSTSTAPQNSDRGGWQHFTPQPRSNSNDSRRSFGNSNGSFNDRGGNDRSMNDRSVSNGRYGNQSMGNPSMNNRSYGNSAGDRSYGGYSRGNEGYSRPSYGGNGGGYSRPPLNMRQPVVTQRSAPSYGGGSRGGYSGGGSHSSGGGGGASHGGGGGGGHSGGGRR